MTWSGWLLQLLFRSLGIFLLDSWLVPQSCWKLKNIVYSFIVALAFQRTENIIWVIITHMIGFSPCYISLSFWTLCHILRLKVWRSFEACAIFLVLTPGLFVIYHCYFIFFCIAGYKMVLLWTQTFCFSKRCYLV